MKFLISICRLKYDTYKHFVIKNSHFSIAITTLTSLPEVSYLITLCGLILDIPVIFTSHFIFIP